MHYPSKFDFSQRELNVICTELEGPPSYTKQITCNFKLLQKGREIKLLHQIQTQIS